MVTWTQRKIQINTRKTHLHYSNLFHASFPGNSIVITNLIYPYNFAKDSGSKI